MSVTDPKQPFRQSTGVRGIHTNQRSRMRNSPSHALTRKPMGASLCLLATPAFAEVSDQVLSVPGMWVQAVVIGCAAFLAGRFRWWLGLPFMILPVVIALSTFGLRHTSAMGPDIIKEQGESYFLNFYASALLAAVMVAMGISVGWRRRKTSTEEIDTR